MTISELGALGEFVGSIGVIVTLAYLAVQVRQNSRQIALTAKSLQADSYQNALNLFVELQTRLFDDEKMLAMNGAPRESWADLGVDPNDEERFLHLCGNFSRNLQHLFFKHRDGLVSEELWQSHARAFSMFWKNSPGAYYAFQQYRDEYDPLFREFVDGVSHG